MHKGVNTLTQSALAFFIYSALVYSINTNNYNVYNK